MAVRDEEHRPVVLAVDGNSLVHRSFHAQARTEARDATGRPCWAVRGLLMQLVAAVDRLRPDGVVIGFDDPAWSLRRDTWPGYKAQRADKLDSLVEQLAAAVQVLHALGLSVVVPEGLEADDVLASTAARAREAGARTVVVTSDRDSFALIDDSTTVLRVINGGVDASPVMTAERLVTLLGVRPEQYRDYAALRGDPSDNLPGVHGIGPRSAARLLTRFGSAEAAFADLDGVRGELGAGLARKLADPAARPAWEHNRRVMALHDELAIALPLGPEDRGALPLPADVVGDVFRAQSLVWSVSGALAALAHIDAPAPVPPRTVSWWGRSDDPLPAGPAPRRLPALPRRAPAPAQLSLFD